MEQNRTIKNCNKFDLIKLKTSVQKKTSLKNEKTNHKMRKYLQYIN